MTEELAKKSATEALMHLSDIKGVEKRPGALGLDDLRGTENIELDEMQLPRLAIAQGLSPQLIPSDTSYIEGLKLFDLYNNVTGEVYGKGPLRFVPIRRDVRRIEFIPRAEGGGVRDANVPPRDPRLDWSMKDGVRIPPVATTFVEFVVLLIRANKLPEPIVLSMKQTNKFMVRAAKQLTTFVVSRHAPIFAGFNTVASGSEKNDKGTFGVYVIRNDHFIPLDTPAGAALYKYAEEFAETIKEKDIVVDRQAGEDETEFDTAAMDATVRAGM